MKTRLLKCIPANRITRNGFAWPKRGTVECRDWDPSPQCGGGLHAWRWIPGDDPNCIDYHSAGDCVWLVVEAFESDIVDLDGKCKFRCGQIIFSGSFLDAVARLKRPPDRAGFNGTATAGDGGTATAWVGGTATAGDGGTATAGVGGTATAGYRGTATAGDGGVICITFLDKANERWARRVALVGENGIDAGKPYRLDAAGRFVEAAQ